MVGYATIYTMAPVFSLVLDRDVSEDLALLYPELYKELTKVCMRLNALKVVVLMHNTGTTVILQDFLHVAHDKRLSR